MIVPEPDREAVGSEASALGLDLEEIREDTRGSTWSVTVVVDADGGVDLDTLAELSRTLDARAEAWGGPDRPVTLEVTSRGVDAPLTEPRHWRRARGRSLELRYVDGASGPEVARVGDVDEAAGTVRLVTRRGRKAAAESVALDSVDHAAVRVEFRDAPEDEIALLTADTGLGMAPAGGTTEGERS